MNNAAIIYTYIIGYSININCTSKLIIIVM